MNAPKRSLFPAVAAAIAATMPDLLLWQNPDTGRWSWKRTGKPWITGFATMAQARADAERLGLRRPYRPVIVSERE